MDTKKIEYTVLEPWMGEPDILLRAVAGKLAEESSELANICARIIIQGSKESEPVSGKPNLQALEEEIGDVLANIFRAIHHFNLDAIHITQRQDLKEARLREWDQMILERKPSNPPR